MKKPFILPQHIVVAAIFSIVGYIITHHLLFTGALFFTSLIVAVYKPKDIWLYIVGIVVSVLTSTGVAVALGYPVTFGLGGLGLGNIIIGGGVTPSATTTTLAFDASTTTSTVKIFDAASDCIDECGDRDYDDGACLWPSEEEDGYVKLGGCLIEGTRHCGNPGQCNCYCWDTGSTTTSTTVTTTSTSTTYVAPTTTLLDCSGFGGGSGYYAPVRMSDIAYNCPNYCNSWCSGHYTGGCYSAYDNGLCCGIKCYGSPTTTTTLHTCHIFANTFSCPHWALMSQIGYNCYGHCSSQCTCVESHDNGYCCAWRCSGE